MYQSFQDYAKSVKPLLDAAFTDHLARLLGYGGTFGFPDGINLLNGGKKIRGSLLCLVTAALGGDLEDAVPRAVAVELIQTATLIHDDLVDQHRSRRNMAAIWTIEGGRRAVLLGDIVFASAIQMMSEMGREDGLIVSRAIADVSRGAYRERGGRGRPGSLRENHLPQNRRSFRRGLPIGRCCGRSRRGYA
jgi:geranylgeranyl pyrophosphate synthase